MNAIHIGKLCQHPQILQMAGLVEDTHTKYFGKTSVGIVIFDTEYVYNHVCLHVHVHVFLKSICIFIFTQLPGTPKTIDSKSPYLFWRVEMHQHTKRTSFGEFLEGDFSTPWRPETHGKMEGL